jgi:hypothetical protein
MGRLRLRRGGLLFRLRRLSPPPVQVILGVVWRARTPVLVVSAQVAVVVVKGVRIVVIVTAVLVVVLVESIVGPPVL